MIGKITNYLMFVCGLLGWWQARLLVSDNFVNGAPFELGRVSLYATQIIFFLTMTLLLWQWFKAGKQLRFKNAWYGVFVALIIYLVLNTLLLSNNLLGFSILGQWLLVLLFVFAVTHASEKDYKNNLILGLISGAVLLAIWAWWQWLFQYQFASTLLGVAEHLPSQPGTAVVINFSDRIMRAYAGLPHPNILGGYLALAVLIVIAEGKKLFARNEKLIYPLLILLTSALMLTFSRSAFLGLIAGLLLASVNLQFLKNNYKQLLAIFFTGLIMVSAYSNLFFSRITASNYVENKSVTERVSGYKQYRADISEHWLFGRGLSGYQAQLKTASPQASGYEIQPIHNAWLFLVAQIGLAGLVLFALLMSLSKPNWMILACLLIIGMFDHYLVSFYSGMVIFIIALTSACKHD